MLFRSEFVNLVRGHRARLPMLRAEHLGGARVEEGALLRRPGSLAFMADPSAANQVDPVVALRARHVVRERQRLDGEPESRKLVLQGFQLGLQESKLLAKYPICFLLNF